MKTDPKGRARNQPCPRHPAVKAKKCRECLPPDSVQREADRRAQEAKDRAEFAALPEVEQMARRIEARRRREQGQAAVAALLMLGTPPGRF